MCVRFHEGVRDSMPVMHVKLGEAKSTGPVECSGDLVKNWRVLGYYI